MNMPVDPPKPIDPRPVGEMRDQPAPEPTTRALREALEGALKWFESDDFVPTVGGNQPWKREQVILGPVTKGVFDKVRAALASSPQQAGAVVSVPDGWQLVPKAPTNDQIIAGLERSLSWMAEHGVTAMSPFDDYPSPGKTITVVYATMLAASPPPPVREIGEEIARILFDRRKHRHPNGSMPNWDVQPDLIRGPFRADAIAILALINSKTNSEG